MLNWYDSSDVFDLEEYSDFGVEDNKGYAEYLLETGDHSGVDRNVPVAVMVSLRRLQMQCAVDVSPEYFSG